MSIVLHGVAAGKGIAVGHAHLITRGTAEVPQYDVSDDLIDAETARFDAAIKATRKELEQLRSAIPENAPTELGAFISLHLMLLTDVTLSREPVDILKEQKINAEWALKQQSDKLAAQFDGIGDAYLRERKQDMLQVVQRIHNNLVGQGNDLNVADNLFDETVLIAHDLSPADTVLFREQRIAAFVTDVGGPTSHTAILGRSLDIPSVIGLHNARKLITEGETVIVDGINGVLIISPDESVLNEYRRRAREYRSHKRELNKLKKTAAATADGVCIELLGNIESAEDVKLLHNLGADGIGLFRSEFLYLNRDTMPSEDEQYEVYSAIVKKMKGKSVTIRTVDLGVDKNPRWFGQNATPNGSLNPVRMMWPMITSLSEVRQCLIHLDTAQRQLTERGEAFGDVGVGCMIEIPSAALTVGSILKLVDFISIGTNDLIQYILSVDRGDDSVSHLYQPGHPSVLKMLQHVIRTANRMEKDVSVCGEMAGDTAFTRILLGMGLRRFSMNPNNILSVKNIILHSNAGQLEGDTAKVIRCEDEEKSEKLIKQINSVPVEEEGEAKVRK